MSDAPKKLFLIDGFAMIFRSFFALNRPNRDGSTSLINPNFRNSKGVNTSTMFTYTNSLYNVLQKEKPTHIAMVLDTPVPTFRHEMYEEYKANRPPAPEDLKIAIPYVIEITEAMNIPIIKCDGYEADDVIGTLAKKAEQEGFETYMMTPDKDYAQLISENIFMYRPGRAGNDIEVWDVEKVREKFEVEHPEQVIDYLGMMGDKVDNIPGIPGVGDKTAKKFIAAYGGMHGLYENTEELKGKMKEKVLANRELAFLSRELATIMLDVPVAFEGDALVTPTEVNRDAVKKVFNELEFRTLYRRILGEEPEVGTSRPEPQKPGAQIDIFNAAADDTAAEQTEFKTIENTKHSYYFIDTPEKRKTLVEQLAKQKSFCFDTETTSINSMLAEMVGLSFAWKTGEAYYVPTPADRVEATSIIEEFRGVFEDAGIGKIGQNIKYDLQLLRNYGIEVKGDLFDTMVAHYLLAPDKKHNMDVLAEGFLNYQPVSITTLIGKKGKNQKNMRDLPPADVSDYACEDADITLQLKEKLEPLLEEKGVRKLFDEVEIPLIRVLSAMENEGINLDVESLRSLSETMVQDIENIVAEIYELAGGEFLISSPKQVGEVLFERLKIVDKPKKTKTGQYATSEDVLSKLADKHEIVQKILTYRELVKLKNTYVDVLPELIHPETKHIHTSYNQVVAATGRLSSDHPNLQNIPIRTERGREVRKAFVPRDENHVLLAADYSQIELRIIAEISGDERMVEAFKQGSDIHAATAANVYGVPLEEVTREMRSNAKMVNFGIIYGISAFGLAQRANIPRKEAKEIIENYFKNFPKIKEYMDQSVERAREKGYCETLLGRRRYLKDINSPNAIVRGAAERNAINAPIQGSAADMIKIAMINVHQAFEERGFKSRMLLQVHDELVFDAHKDELETITPLIKELMEGAISMNVPLEVEAGTGTTWLEAH